MMKRYKGKLVLSSVVLMLPMLVGVLFWDSLPERIATHWGIDGVANGWSSRPVAVFGLPLFLLVLHWVCMLVTSKDPGNKGQNSKVIEMIFWICPVLSLFTCGLTYAAAFGREISVQLLTFEILGLMFIIVGNYLPKCKQNHTIGIKIKWTLENEENWNATHRMSGKLWVAGGLLFAVCGFLPEAMVFQVSLVLLLLLVGVPVWYSYRYHQKQINESMTDTE